MIELLSSTELDGDKSFMALPDVPDDSMSAIVLDRSYYEYAIKHSTQDYGLPCLTREALSRGLSPQVLVWKSSPSCGACKVLVQYPAARAKSLSHRQAGMFSANGEERSSPLYLSRRNQYPAEVRKGPFYKSFAGSGPTGFLFQFCQIASHVILLVFLHPRSSASKCRAFRRKVPRNPPRPFLVVKHIQSSIYGSVRPFLPVWHVALYHTQQVEPTFHLFHIRKRSSASKIKAALVSWGQKLGIFQGWNCECAAMKKTSLGNLCA